MGDTATIGGGDPYVLVVAQLVEGIRLPLRGRSHAGEVKTSSRLEVNRRSARRTRARA